MQTASQFLSAIYDGKWYIGVIKQVDFSNGEFLLDFMHPNGPSSSFSGLKSVTCEFHSNTFCV